MDVTPPFSCLCRSNFYYLVDVATRFKVLAREGVLVVEPKKRYKLLTKSGVFRIVVILYEHGPMPVHQLTRYGIGAGTAYRASREAALLGFVRLYECGSSMCVELTERGRRAAELLSELLNLMINGYSG